MKNFQLVLVIIFIFGGILGILVFAGFINLDDTAVNKQFSGTVKVWGSIPGSVMAPLIEDLNKNKTYNINYYFINPNTFNEELLEAIALGQGPDLFLVSNDSIYEHINKISVIPYTNYPLVNFKNNFVQASDVFLVNEGALALPLVVDPLVLYYNRSILDSNGTVFPPYFWEDLEDYSEKFTKKDEAGQIERSAFALGVFDNINHSKDILSAMFLQTGNPIIQKAKYLFESVLIANLDNQNNTAQALDFYTSFSNPLKDNYSWNKSFPNSLDMFSKEDLVFYFGLASDFEILINKNPNQNFQIAELPQYKNTQKATYAKVLGVAMSNFSKNQGAAFDAMYSMSESSFVSQISKIENLPPARRDLLNQGSANSYLPVFYSSALFAKSWLDPSFRDTNIVFRAMVDQVLSNERDAIESITAANNRINILFRN